MFNSIIIKHESVDAFSSQHTIASECAGRKRTQDAIMQSSGQTGLATWLDRFPRV
jgi:hypothetical protein